jgi:hypothetical protein
MRFMILVRATAQSEGETDPTVPDPAVLKAMADYHEALVQAGVLLDAKGLRPSREGWRVHYGATGGRHVIDGPFAETKELVAGYTLIEVRSREEALEWSRRFPAPFLGIDCEIEVRPIWELDDFAPNEDVERFRRINPQR